MAGFDPVRESSASSSSTSYAQRRQTVAASSPTDEHDAVSAHWRHGGEDDDDDDDGADREHRRPSRSASIVALLNPSEEREPQRPSSSASLSQRPLYDGEGSHPSRHPQGSSPPPLGSLSNRSSSRPSSSHEHFPVHSPMSVAGALNPSSAPVHGAHRSSSAGSASGNHHHAGAAYPSPSHHHHHHHHSSSSSSFYHPDPQQTAVYSPRYYDSSERSSAHPAEEVDRHVSSLPPPSNHGYYDHPSAHAHGRRPSLRMESRSVSQGSHPGSTGGGSADSPRSIHAMHSRMASPVESARTAHLQGGYHPAADSPRTRMVPLPLTAAPPPPSSSSQASASPHFSRPVPGGFRVPEIPAHRSPEFRRVPLPLTRSSQDQYAYPPPPASEPHYHHHQAGPPGYPPTPTMGSPSQGYAGHPYPAAGPNTEYFRPPPAGGAYGQRGEYLPGSLPPTPGTRGSIGSATHHNEAYSPPLRGYPETHGPPSLPTPAGPAYSGPTPAGAYSPWPPTPGSGANPSQHGMAFSPPIVAASAARRQSQQSEASMASYEEHANSAAAADGASISKRRRKSSSATAGAGGAASSSRRSSQASFQSQEDIQAANAAAATMLSVGRKPSMHLAEDSVMYSSPSASASSPPPPPSVEAKNGVVGDDSKANVNGLNGNGKGSRDDLVEKDTQDGVKAEEEIKAEAKGDPDTDAKAEASSSGDVATAKRKRSPDGSSIPATAAAAAAPAATTATTSATPGKKVKPLDLDEVDRLAQRDTKKRKSVSSLKDATKDATKSSVLPASLPSRPDVGLRSDAANAPPADIDDGTIPYRPTQRVSMPDSVRQPLSREALIALYEATIRRGSNRLRVAWAENERQQGREPRDGFQEGFVDRWDRRATSAASTSGGDVDTGASAAAAAARVQADRESEVARHYNNRREVGLSARGLSPILPLKRFNNWVKSVLIGKFGTRNSKVFDMGGGKGGDLNKWEKLGVRELVLADIAATSVEQAENRYNERSFRFRASFFALDCFGQTLGEVMPLEVLSPPFDMVSLQFCMHYGWSSLQNARLVIENVSRYLAQGGVFIGTIPDSDTLYRRRDALAEDEWEFGNSKYHVRFEQKEKRKPFGDKYTFFLDDAVEDVPEYVVDWDQFESLANEYGLTLSFKQTMSGMWQEFRQDREYGALARRMQVCQEPRYTAQPMDDDLWAATTVYCAFCFTKTR